MTASLTIVRYPKRFAFFGFLSMAIFPLFLRRNKSISFYKLMGSGKNGTFDVHPDLRQWAVMAVYKNDISSAVNNEMLYGKKISRWWQRYRCEVMTIWLEPIEGHGKWDGKECFGHLPKQSSFNGMIGVLTRASIRVSKVKAFWKNVGAAAGDITNATGFITSFGIGEVPWIKQATFSVWGSKEAMKTYAYKQKPHQQVIEKTRKENWYSEEMFVRFRILSSAGTLNGKNEVTDYLRNNQ